MLRFLNVIIVIVFIWDKFFNDWFWWIFDGWYGFNFLTMLRLRMFFGFDVNTSFVRMI
jgi:hypothetical protein